ncbi:MAG: MlaA family lipoprotein, partial [Pseudomonadales bacterium]
PLLGPSNLRDSVGRVVDAVLLDPVDYILVQPEANYRTAADLSSLLQTRNALRDQINSLFNVSADSYAQARLIYLQNRRFKLEDVSSETYFDPYEDFE